MKKRVVLAVGCRPDAIKMMPLYKELLTRNSIKPILLSTGQQKQNLEKIFAEFSVKPDYDLKIMRKDQSTFEITINVLSTIQDVLDEIEPDLVLVCGDTTSAFAIALACYYMRIPLGHVEAGLRTNNIYFPYPEEMNRKFISMIAQYNFAPTKYAKANLVKEGVKEENIYVTGNTIIDTLPYTVRPNYTHKELEWVGDDKLIFITAHRRESIGKAMHNMFKAIRKVLEENKDVKAIYPIHMNPQVRKAALEELGECDRIHIIEPLDVVDCHNFEASSYLILTDSGGIQEEAPTMGIPVLVMKKTTDRPEGVIAGTSKVVGTSEQSIYKEFSKLIKNKSAYAKMSKKTNPYGDGHACERIANIIEGKEYQEWKN